MKQTIEIEVPEGKKAVYKDGKITFIPKELVYTDIKTVTDAIQYLRGRDIGNSIVTMYDILVKEYNIVNNFNYNRIPYEFAVVCFRAVKLACEHLKGCDDKNLIRGDLYYPVVQMCGPDYIKNCYGDKVVGRIEYREKQYLFVGGNAGDGSPAGLAGFNVLNPVSTAWTNVGFRLFSDKEIAKYVSTQFGKLCFLVQFGGTPCNFKFVE